jgi:hypothetical protein
MSNHTPPPDRLRFILPSRQRRSFLIFSAIFGVVAALMSLLPGEKDLERLAWIGLSGAACPLFLLGYFLYNRDYTELDAHGIRVLRYGIFWQQHTGRPFGAPKTVRRTYNRWGRYHDRVIHPGDAG